MQALQNTTVAFCIACICAELVSLLVGPNGWTHRCIKTVACLYILVVLLRWLPGAPSELKKASVSNPTPVQLDDTISLILSQTQTRLQETLEAECAQQFGLDVRLKIQLEQAGNEIRALQAAVYLPSGVKEPQIQKVTAFLKTALGTENIQCMEKEDG